MKHLEGVKVWGPTNGGVNHKTHLWHFENEEQALRFAAVNIPVTGGPYILLKPIGVFKSVETPFEYVKAAEKK